MRYYGHIQKATSRRLPPKVVNGPITHQPLPFSFGALEPHIPSSSLMVHYNKHHANYVLKLNELIANTEYKKLSLEEIIFKSAKDLDAENSLEIFNNASQTWNHTFFWNCLSQNHNQTPSKTLTRRLAHQFGSTKLFVKLFTLKASELFGSGWTWLVKNKDEQLQIVNYSNADSPLLHDLIPLLTCDVWEHAYYLDYKNNRADYLKNFWKLVNWRFVDKNAEILNGSKS